MDHPLEVARQRLQVDGKPHPTAPSYPQAPKPVGALQLGVRSLDTSPYVIPLAPLLGGLGPPAPLDVHLHQVRLEDVGPRTPVQLHWATGSQGAGLACCPGKVDLYPLRRILQLVLLDGRVAGGAHRGLLPCDVDLKVRGGERRWSVTLSFVLAESPTQPAWDLVGTSPDAPDIFVQVKVGGQGYADEVVDAMQEDPNIGFAVSGEVYDAIEESHPELLGRLIEIGPAAELTESLKDGLDKLASNFGVDVPDGLGAALLYVAEVVLGIRLIWGMVKTERELGGVELTDRSRVHGIRTLALASRFGINQVCMWAGISGGTAAGSVVPGVGNITGGLAGLGGGMMLNRLLQPRIEEVAMKLIGGDADDMFYLMNKVEVDQVGDSLAATQVA